MTAALDPCARYATASNWVGFLRSDPNSRQNLQAGQRGLLGSDRNFEQAEGFLGSDPNSGQSLRAGNRSVTDFGSDPNNPDPNNSGSFHPFMPSAMASKCVVGVDALLFVFILAPLSPPALSRPAGRERELTPIFGRVYKQGKYTCQGTLNSQKNFQILNSLVGIGCFGPPAVEAVLSSAAAGELMMSTCISSEYFLALNTWPNMAVGSSSPPGGAGKGRGE